MRMRDQWRRWFCVVTAQVGLVACSSNAKEPVTSNDVSEMEGACRTNGERSGRSDCAVNAFCRCAAVDYQTRAADRTEYRSIMSGIHSYLNHGSYYCLDRTDSECPDEREKERKEEKKAEEDDDSETQKQVVIPAGQAHGLPVADPNSFTIGSTRETVESIQGKPDRIDTSYTERWWYGAATIEFEKGRVRRWSIIRGTLRATLSPVEAQRFEAARARGTFTIGDTKDDVLGVHGVPTNVDDQYSDRWWYQGSTVEFDKGKVNGWNSVYYAALSVHLEPRDPAVAASARERGTYARGSTSDEVLAIEGVPTYLDRGSGETWWYGPSRIRFSKGRVVELNSYSLRPLKGTQP